MQNLALRSLLIEVIYTYIIETIELYNWTYWIV